MRQLFHTSTSSIASLSNRRRLWLAGALVLVLTPASQPGHAQVDPYRLYLAERGEIPWHSLSPEEQDTLKRHRGKWNDYSGERQEKMRKGAKRYLDLPPEKRRAVDEQRRHYQQLSPEERERLREEYQRDRGHYR